MSRARLLHVLSMCFGVAVQKLRETCFVIFKTLAKHRNYLKGGSVMHTVYSLATATPRRASRPFFLLFTTLSAFVVLHSFASHLLSEPVAQHIAVALNVAPSTDRREYGFMSASFIAAIQKQARGLHPTESPRITR